MSLRKARTEHWPRASSKPAPIGIKAFCTLLLGVSGFIFGVPPTNAQGAPESDPQKCAYINLAHYYFRCANVNNAILGLLEDGLKRNPAGASQTQHEAATVIKTLMNEYIGISLHLYKLAGRGLTPDIASARQRADEKDVVAAVDEWLKRTLAGIKREKVMPKPGHVLELCARPSLGQEIKDNDRVNARLLLFQQEAKQLLSKQQSCLK
jgi:hypothetical protein